MSTSSMDKRKLTLFALTWPIFIEILLHMIMGSADTLMLSQYNDDAVAAVGVSNQVLQLVIVMFGFIATGTAIMVAQHLGAKQDGTAAEIVVVSIGVNSVFSLFLSGVLFLFAEKILVAMHLPGELMDRAVFYLQIVGLFSFVQALLMTIGASLRSYGFTKDAMYITIGINIMNIFGNYVLIFGQFGFPEMGVKGVAISTVVSRAIGLIFIFVILLKRILVPFKQLLGYAKKHTLDLLKIGVPTAGEHVSYNTSQMMITIFITSLGTVALTTKVYTQNLMMFALLFGVAIGQGTQILIGHLVGEGNHEKAYSRCLKSLRIAMIISTGISFLFYLFSNELLGIFTDNDEIIRTGSILILLTIILEPGRSFNLVVINALRAAGDVKFPVYLGILSMWGISVPVAYLLGIHFNLGLVGIWIAFILDEWLRGILMLWRWRSKVWLDMSFVRSESLDKAT
ncbi:MATE family efflux transporter [Bacillus sp. Marseille-Q3570]|uniref:MATE family efflux transporter n=1 Tax=Bacillus sp. Marseille-Q3570 TaxID=2963522 RepID=UPI0021B76E9C|nr:MATE family efflux transporter [Bacillus sp. Marseille-Q3570]